MINMKQGLNEAEVAPGRQKKTQKKKIVQSDQPTGVQTD